MLGLLPGVWLMLIGTGARLAIGRNRPAWVGALLCAVGGPLGLAAVRLLPPGAFPAQLPSWMTPSPWATTATSGLGPPP